MKQLKFTKFENNQKIEGVLRVHQKDLFFKYLNTEHARQIVDQFRKKGIRVTEGRGWVRVELLRDHELVKLGNNEINVKEDSDEVIENKLYEFYKEQYKILGFFLEEGLI